jgi:hypothetical protein
VFDENDVVIKDYSENEGILAALQQREIIGQSTQVIRVGHAHAYVCPLLMPVENFA